MKAKYLVLIPAYNPENEFVNYVQQLKVNGFENIIIVNDGSEEQCCKTFSLIENQSNCFVIHHTINRGKGAALKTGFKYILNKYESFEAVITLDADGQHLIKDVLQLKEMNIDQETIYLGVRKFHKDEIPFRSRLGNVITRYIFKILYGKNISDTQTGFRVYPKKILNKILNLEGEGYEFEMSVLINNVNLEYELGVFPISTIYIENNKKSHFNPISDSFKIYKILLGNFMGFSTVSILSAFVDISLFQILNIWLNSKVFHVAYSVVFSRIISSLFNYAMNYKYVFRSESKVVSSVKSYYILAIIQVSISAGVLQLLSLFYPKFRIVILKVMLDTMIFLVSYKVQKNYIFNK